MAPTATLENCVGEAHALALYETEEGRRVLVGQRIDGVVRITDRPLDRSGRRVDPNGRPYLVEPQVSTMAELDALVADYSAYAERHGDCPMRASVINLLDTSRLAEAVS